MGKLTAAVLFLLMLFNFFGSDALRVKFAEKTGLELIQVIDIDPQYDETGEIITYAYELRWNDREYEQFGIKGSDVIAGDLFGLTDMMNAYRVLSVAGEKPEDWLIWIDGEFMGVWVLCKEKSVTEIPDGFEPFER